MPELEVEDELETPIQKRIRLALGMDRRVVLWRNNCGALKNPRGRTVVYGLCPGSSDLIGLTHKGRFFALEVKRSTGGRLSEKQKLFIALVNRMGGYAAMVESVEGALNAVEEACKE